MLIHSRLIHLGKDGLGLDGLGVLGSCFLFWESRYALYAQAYLSRILLSCPCGCTECVSWVGVKTPPRVGRMNPSS